MNKLPNGLYSKVQPHFSCGKVIVTFSNVLKKVTVTFPSEKVFSHRRPSGSQALRVTQCCGPNLPNRWQPRQNKNRRSIPPLIG
jgi:hypothetical protein